jgi:hypothetical protein
MLKSFVVQTPGQNAIQIFFAILIGGAQLPIIQHANAIIQ